MKHLIMLSLLVIMTACNGSGGGSTDPEITGGAGDFSNTCVDANNNFISCSSNIALITLQYNSLGAYQNTGRSLDLMRAPSGSSTNFDENRPLIIPQFVTLLQDSANSLQINDIARIQFVYVACDYRWNGSQFAFWRCIDVLSVPTHAALASSIQHGDTLYLSDVYEPSNPSQSGKIQFGVVRNPAANHTGTIRLQASLQ